MAWSNLVRMRAAAGVVLPVVGVGVGTEARAQLPVTVVALSGVELGSQSPGLGAGTSWSSFGPPVIDATGNLAFSAVLQGENATTANNGGVWSHAPGQSGHTLFIRKGAMLPGGGDTYSSATFVYSSGGKVGVVGSGATVSRVFLGGLPGAPGLIARIGSAAPGGTTYGGIIDFETFNNGRGMCQGQSIVSSLVQTFGWCGAPGSVVAYAASPLAAPGAGGATWSPGNEYPVGTVNSAGTVACGGKLAGSGVTASVNDTAVWVGPPGSLSMLARGGDAAPGTTVNYASSFHAFLPQINASGQVCFVAQLTGTMSQAKGYFVGTPGSVALAARLGTAAPGAGAATFSTLATPTFNNQGRLAFYGTLTGGGSSAADNAGLWVGPPGSIVLAVRRGQQAPGLPAGAVFSLINSDVSPSLTETGRIVFSATLTGAPAGSTTGVWGWNPADGLYLIARAGQAVTIGPSDVRTISSITSAFRAGGDDGQRSGVSNGGPVVFAANFTDGSRAVLLTGYGAPCRVDIVGLGSTPGPDGAVTVDDLVAFLAAFFANNLALADIVGPGGTLGADGSVTVDDLVAFLSLFFAECT